MAIKDEGFETSVRLAAYYVEDASDGRLDNGLASNFKSGQAHTFHCCLVQTHIAWHAVVIAACVFHSLLVVFEQSPGATDTGRGWSNFAELLLVGVYVADILLKVSYMGAGTFLSLRGSKVWQTTYAVLTVILLLEALIAPQTRVSRPLRPLVLVLRSRSVRNFYMTVLRICPSLLKVLMLLVFLLLVSALAMARLLRGTGSHHFSSSAAAFRELGILLLTQDNYQDLLDDLLRHGGLASLLLFFAFVVVGILFLMQLVLGTVIDTYMEEAQKELRSKRVKQAKGLMRAFVELDLRKEGRLRQKAFDRLLQRLRPSDSPFERQLKFSLLSNKYKACGNSAPSTPGHEVSPLSAPLPKLPETSAELRLESLSYVPGAPEPTIDPIDFLYLHTVLELTFKPRKPAWDVPGVSGEQPRWSCFAENLAATQHYEALSRASMWVDAATFLADAETLELLPGFLLNDLLHIVFLLQVLVQVLALGSPGKAWRFSSSKPLLRGELVLASGLFLVSILACLIDHAPGARLRSGVASLGALRSLRLAATSNFLARFCQCLADILPAMTQMLGLICVMQYTFAAIAVEVLGRQGAPGFSTLLQGASSLLQVLLGAEGTAVARAAVGEAHPASALVFVVYYAIAVLVVLNLVTALMIEFYRASLAENVQHRDQRQLEITRQVQDFLREMEVVEHLGFEVSATSKESGIEKLRASFLGQQENLVDEELLRQVQKEWPTDLIRLHRSKSGSLGGSTPKQI